MMKKRIGQWFTFSLLLITAAMAYQNVISDDAAVRDLAKRTATETAGCGRSCRISGFRGERGMIHETIEYDFDPQGHFVVKCRRAMMVAGDYACVVTEGGRMSGSGSSASASSASGSSSATPPPSH